MEGVYFALYDENEVNIYDGKKAKIIITEEAVLKDYRCPREKLWRIPLIEDVQNENTDTIILNIEDGQKSLNTLYQVPTTEYVMDTLHFILDGKPSTSEGIYHMYNLPSIKPAIRYLHAAAGFPTTHMDKSNTQRKLPNLASHHSKKCGQILSRI